MCLIVASPEHVQQFEAIFGPTGNKVLERIRSLSPRMVEHVYSYIAGDLYADTTLDLKSRELCVITCLASQGGLNEQLKVHVETGLRLGLTKQQIAAAIETVGSYAGVPRALNAMFTAIEVFGAWDEAHT